MTGISEKKNNAEGLVDAIIHGLQEVKGKEITILNLENIPNTICSKFIICHGDSHVQVEALADSTEKHTRTMVNERPISREGLANAEWIILDYFDVVVHIFQKETRAFYDLEKLWADADVEVIDYQI